MSRAQGDLSNDARSSLTLPLRPARPPVNEQPLPEVVAPVPASLEHRSLTGKDSLPSSPASSFPPFASHLRAGDRIGDYQILEEIAAGGMGIVYKARQCSLNRIVALKMVLRGDLAEPSELLRFRTEAHAIARLHHANLVSIFETGEHAGVPFYSMEFLAGGPLSRRLAGRPLPHRDAVRLMLPLVGAIDCATVAASSIAI